MQVMLTPGVSLADVEGMIQDIMHAELTDIPAFTDRLVGATVPVWYTVVIRA